MSDNPKQLNVDFAALYFDYITLNEFITTIKTRLIDYTQNHHIDVEELCAYQTVLSWIKTFENDNNIVFKNNLPDLKECENQYLELVLKCKAMVD